jgi:sugar (pentulose or hexulose) kinase
LIDSGEPVGTVRRSIADRFGFSSNVIVSSGGGDNMMAAIGTGNVAPGVITASLGTSGTIYAFSTKPVVDAQGELAAFCSSDGNWLPLACTMNVTVATESMRSLLGLDLDALNEKAGSVPVGSNGVMLLPYFNGERTPALPRAHASLHGLTTTNLTAENLARASMEGATFGLRYALDVLRRNQIAPHEIRLVGGGSRSPLWRRIVADVLGYPVVCPLSSEAGALGAAIQALWCYRRQREPDASLPALTADFVRLNETSRLEPVADNMKQYTDLYQHYLRLNAAMQPMNQ